MVAARTRALMVVATASMLLVPAGVRADYVSVSVPLHSPSLAGPNVGNVVAESNDGSSTVNGLMFGQVRLTYSVNPVAGCGAIAPYGAIGPQFGFQQVGFNTDLSISEGQIALPEGYALNLPSSPIIWAYGKTGNDRAPSVTVLFSGLGNQATSSILR